MDKVDLYSLLLKEEEELSSIKIQINVDALKV